MRVLALAAAAAMLAVPGAARSADTGIAAVCTTPAGGGSCSTGWYTTNVTVSFILPAGSSNPQGCGNQTVAADTAGVVFTCTVTLGDGSQCCRLDVPIKRDATPPTASAITAARSPDANSWYNHAVGVTVAGTDATSGIASCTTTSYSGPDSSSASVTGTCRDNAGNVSAPQTLSFKYDATPPSIDAAPSRPPDANGWYNHPLDVAFSGSDATAGIDACTSGSYSGPDGAGAGVTGTCRDAAGNVATRTFALQYDATPPAVSSAAADRAPDAGEWYNHRVVVTFAGTDATSGIAACDSVPYEKPDRAGASLSGRCTDKAGNASAPGSFTLNYDSTPPTLADVAASPLDRSVGLSWKASRDVAALTVARAVGSAAPSTVYAGRPIASFTDKKLRNGVRYAYTVTARDAAGNAVTRKVVAEPSPPLIAPRQEAHVRGGTTLRWRAVAKATYYNVQLRLRGAKVLTTWPSTPRFHVPSRWTFAGRSYSLEPGRYVWAVWPGFGRRPQHRYGPLIGTSVFVVTR